MNKVLGIAAGILLAISFIQVDKGAREIQEMEARIKTENFIRQWEALSNTGALNRGTAAVRQEMFRKHWCAGKDPPVICTIAPPGWEGSPYEP